MAARGSLTSKVREGQEQQGRQVRRLLRVQRAVLAAALAPRPGAVPRREGGDPRPHPRPGGRRRGERGAHRRALRPQRPGQARRPVAGRHRALGLADPHPDAPERGHPGPAVAGGRGRGGPGVRRQPPRPAAGRAGRRADHDRPGPGLPDRRQGRGHRRHRQGARHRDDLPARAAAPLGRGHRRPGETREGPQVRAHRDRQRHRLAGDRPAGRRTDQAPPRAQA